MTFNPLDPIKDLERLWLRSVARYEVLDADPLMPDADWDQLVLVLRKRWGELSSVFRLAVPFGCIAGSTGSGINWTDGAPAAILEMEKKLLPESFDPTEF